MSDRFNTIATALTAALAAEGFETRTWANDGLYLIRPELSMIVGYLTIEADGSITLSRFRRPWRKTVLRIVQNLKVGQ